MALRCPAGAAFEPGTVCTSHDAQCDYNIGTDSRKARISGLMPARVVAGTREPVVSKKRGLSTLQWTLSPGSPHQPDHCMLSHLDLYRGRPCSLHEKARRAICIQYVVVECR